MASAASGGKPAYDYLIKLLLIGDSGTLANSPFSSFNNLPPKKNYHHLQTFKL